MTGFWLGLKLLNRPEWHREKPAGNEVVRGRYMAENGEPMAVFLVGMRINRWRSPRGWLPVMFALPGMMRELAADPDSGLLGYRLLGGPGLRQIMLIQYWRKAGDIRAFAHDAARAHSPAQERFWRRYLAGSGAVGIWHEMLSVNRGAYQCIYGDMPPTGIGAIRGLVPVAPGEHGGYRPTSDPLFHAQLAGTGLGRDTTIVPEDIPARQ